MKQVYKYILIPLIVATVQLVILAFLVFVQYEYGDFNLTAFASGCITVVTLILFKQIDRAILLSINPIVCLAVTSILLYTRYSNTRADSPKLSLKSLLYENTILRIDDSLSFMAGLATEFLFAVMLITSIFSIIMIAINYREFIISNKFRFGFVLMPLWISLFDGLVSLIQVPYMNWVDKASMTIQRVFSRSIFLSILFLIVSVICSYTIVRATSIRISILIAGVVITSIVGICYPYVHIFMYSSISKNEMLSRMFQEDRYYMALSMGAILAVYLKSFINFRVKKLKISN